LFYSPSDLTAYLACEHLTQLEFAVAGGEIVKPRVEDPQAELIRRKGEEHERAYLPQLLASVRDVVTIELADRDGGGWDWERGARETEDAIRAGREVIYQESGVESCNRSVAPAIKCKNWTDASRPDRFP